MMGILFQVMCNYYNYSIEMILVQLQIF